MGVLAGVALASYWVTKQILLKALRAAFAKRSGQADHASFLRFVRRLANVPPAFVLEIGIGSVPRLAPWFVSLIRNVALGVMIVIAAIAISAALDWLNHLYARRPNSRSRPIKGYLQVAKIAVFSAAAILTVAVLIDRSPVVLLSGLGAMAAVLLLVFKDTILSLVASVQLTSNDMIRVGD